MVGERVEHWAGGARVTGPRGVVGGPGAVEAGGVRGDDGVGGVGGEDEVEEEEGKVPA